MLNGKNVLPIGQCVVAGAKSIFGLRNTGKAVYTKTLWVDHH